MPEAQKVAKTIELPKMLGRALIVENTFDKNNRTVEVTFATETPVLRYDYNVGRFMEILSFDPSHVRFERFESGGASVLNDHNKWNLENVIGVVLEASLEKGRGRAKIQLSDRESIAGIVNDIEKGIIRNVSIGYNVYKYEPIETGEEGETPSYRAVDWEPYELSFTPVPADFLSTVRSKEERTHSVEILTNSNTNKMPESTKTAGGEEKTPTPTPTPASTERNNDPPAPAPAPAPARTPAPAADESKLRTEGAEQERARIAEIGEVVRSLNLPEGDAFEKEHIEKGTTVDEVRKLAIAKWAEADPSKKVAGGNLQVTQDEGDKQRSQIELALELRTNPELKNDDGKQAKVDDNYRHFRHMSLLDVARAILDQQGIEHKNFTKQELASRALSTSDYPLLLANVGNKSLVRAYKEAPQTWKPLASRMDATDFKTLSMVALGGSVELEKVKEDGEFKSAKLAEKAETFKLETYGKIIPLTRQAIINDDLNGFARVLTMFGRSAARKENDLVWGLITANGNMADGVALFHADHNNLLSPSDLDEDGLTAARVAMARQTGLDGELLNISPSFLLVPPELQTKAEKIMSAVVANATGDVNVFANKMQVIAEPRLTDVDDWYVAASPAEMDLLQYGYLNGSEGVYTETQFGFEVDGVKIKARLDFGASVLDHRGIYKTPGS